MDEMRVTAAQQVMGTVFWLALAFTVLWCVLWSVHHPGSGESDKEREQSRVMLPLYLRLASLSGLTCLIALLFWKGIGQD
ncbi:hypothetical protein ACFOPQ_16545 [Deinococcus antarcticus]|uniref:Transmembrane protein n=1 Tax=Deinococcus antarcticus TaxID=1298767 RepID=A0ABV8ADT4_9DEIO